MRRILVLISILFTLESCLPSSSDTTLIRGRIEGGIADKVSVYVLDYGINEDIEVLDGAFTYEVPTNKAIVATFSCTLDGDEQEVAIIPDGFPLTITFKPDGATQVSDNRKSINHRLAEEEMVYHKQVDGLQEWISLQRSGAPKDQIDSVLTAVRGFSKMLDSLAREDIECHKDNFMAVHALVQLNSLTDERKDSIINTLDSAVIQTARIQMIQRQIHGRLYAKEGMPFVDFCVETDSGETHLSDYVGKGKYVLADFWASWCQPCIMEFPNLKSIYDRYNGDAFTVLGIAVSDKETDSVATIEKHQLPWPQILGTGDVATDAYGIDGIPHIILFGPDGTILYRDLRGERIGQILKDIFGR